MVCFRRDRSAMPPECGDRSVTLDRKAHWDHVYQRRSPDSLSWYQAEPTLSLELIRHADLDCDAPIIDVGGGASVLVDHLLREGYTNLTVLDVSGQALRLSKNRLGATANDVKWLENDLTQLAHIEKYALWHDRAVFHFLTNEEDRKHYLRVLTESLQPGGHLIIATFATDGPNKCSGLDIVQYDAEKMLAVLGTEFKLLSTQHALHITPARQRQAFQYFHFSRITTQGVQ